VNLRSAPATLVLWSCAYVGCFGFLLAGLPPQTQPSIALLSQLGWLALIGSIPTSLLLAATSRAARARRGIVFATALAAAALTAALGWEHTDFLLSGPRWATDPRRTAVRMAMDASIGLLGGAGWLWLIRGMRVRRRRWLALWLAASGLVVILLGAAITWYRAYDFSVAQLVLPAALLTGAMTYLTVRRWRFGALVLGIAVAGSLAGLVTRFVPSVADTGEREVIAHSRGGALVTLYVLPQLESGPTWSPTQEPCPQLRSVVLKAPTGIPPDARRNVILVTVDALRKDALWAHIGGRAVMPKLSHLSKRGVSFQNATSTYPATLFAVGSAFTGLSPAELYLAPVLPETIFSRSRSRVDRQIAVLPDVSWFRLPIVARFLAPGVEPVFAPNDAAATKMMMERLRAARADGASVMAWVHYYSPHDPYINQRRFPFGPGRRNAYLSEVAYFDAALGRFLAYLERDGWLEDSLVIFFSDHGEALGERSYWGHHVYLNGWMIDVPLVLRHAGLAPSRPTVGVSLADVAPTVLHFLGLPIPSDIEAQSLFTLDPDRLDRPSFSEAFPVRGIELFDSFRLPALDDQTIVDRLHSIRVANKGYEPKGAVTRGRYRLVHHRAADTWLLYERADSDAERPIDPEQGRHAAELLRNELEQWERAQLHRIECRLKVEAN
jgi:arylsulfatase A-like enzyme